MENERKEVMKMKRISLTMASLLMIALLLFGVAWAEAEAEAPSLVGVWTYTDEESDMGGIYDLKEDGTGTYTLIFGNEEVTFEIKYEIQDDLLLVNIINDEVFTEEDVMELEFRFEDEQTLIIKDSFEEEMIFVKNQ